METIEKDSKQDVDDLEMMIEMNYGPFMRPVVKTYPPALVKACCDPFQYKMRLSSGETLGFKSAWPVNRDWVCLDPCDDLEFSQGVYVSVHNIVWVAQCNS